MKMHQIVIVVVALACCRAVEAAGSPQLVQAFVGFNQPNTLGLPCAASEFPQGGWCGGQPLAAVWVQPNQFVSSGSTGLYYAVFQENGWSGSLSADFVLSGAGSVIQNMTVNGTISSGQGLLVLSSNATIPATSYSGQAVLTVTTTATPSDGSAPFTLTSYADMEVGTTGTRRLVQAFAGVNAGNQSGFPCVQCGPSGAVGVLPASFLQPGVGAAEYVVFQSGRWAGTVTTTFDMIAGGKHVQGYALGGGVTGPLGFVAMLSAAIIIPVTTGPGSLRTTTTATPRGQLQFITLHSFAPIVIE